MNNEVYKNITLKLWKDIDLVFHDDPKKFIESMSLAERNLYNLSKSNLIWSLVKFWKDNDLKPLTLNTEQAKEKIKSFSTYMAEDLDINELPDKLIEMTLKMMTYIPSIFNLNEDFDPNNYNQKYKIELDFINAHIEDCVKAGVKYSILNEK